MEMNGMPTDAPNGLRSISSPDTISQPELTKREYERLADFRYSLREFARATELEVRRAGLTPQQYLLLLAIKGFPGRDWANISELAERLQIRHNAVIGLVNRAEMRGLVRRAQDADRADRRVVHIHLTPEGEVVLFGLTSALRSERMRVRLAAAAIEAASHDTVEEA
jgi:DNA-binding MarR family transcriptional regulator